MSKLLEIIADNPVAGQTMAWILNRSKQNLVGYFGSERDPYVGDPYIAECFKVVKRAVTKHVQEHNGALPTIGQHLKPKFGRHEREHFGHTTALDTDLHRRNPIFSLAPFVRATIKNRKLATLVAKFPLTHVDLDTGVYYWVFGGVEIKCKPHKWIHFDRPGGVLHATDRAAIAYDGLEIHAWRGMVIPAWIITDAGDLKGKDILREKNAELRRVMFEIYLLNAKDRLVKELGARLISEDLNLGFPRKLYEFEMDFSRWGNTERFLMLEVTNGTQELDGTYKKYYQMVHPDCRTPKEAIAWMNYLPIHHVERSRT